MVTRAAHRPPMFGALPQWLKPIFFSSFTAGLRPSKPKSGLPGGLKGLLHPRGDIATLEAL